MDPAVRTDARSLGPEDRDLLKEEFAMGTDRFTHWAALLPMLAVLTLAGLPALAADRLVIAEEFTNDG
jgi:hypothetical protein